MNPTQVITQAADQAQEGHFAWLLVALGGVVIFALGYLASRGIKWVITQYEALVARHEAVQKENAAKLESLLDSYHEQNGQCAQALNNNTRVVNEFCELVRTGQTQQWQKPQHHNQR